MFLLAWFVFVMAFGFLEAVIIHRDPALIERIPVEVRKKIDESMSRRLERAISAHFIKDPTLFEAGRDVPVLPMRSRRLRRDVTNATETNSTAAGVFSEWSGYGVCSARCGGGQQVRYRTCLEGDCSQLGSYTEARECGNFPCVSGSYVLDSISAFEYIAIPEAKMVRFFTIAGSRYFGYITDTQLKTFRWENSENLFVSHQTIPVTSGVSFDILNTYPRTYIVVIEKALMIFPGRFSKMYYYDPWNRVFQLGSAVTIDVWEPSALKTFDVFGTAFLGIVNYQTKMVTEYGVSNNLLVCDGETKMASCPAGSIITVVNAMYGRVSNYECASGVDVYMSWFRYFATCVVPGTKERVSRICDSNESCELTSSRVNFGGTLCQNTNNYLRVTYTCSSISYMGTPIFYKWDGVGLSLISGSSLVTSGATDLEAFTIHDQQYIAVANYVNDQNEHHLDSEVYIFNLDSGRFQSLQKIRTDGAVDWEFFGVGEGLAQEYFLVVANHIKILPNGVETYTVESVIYKWNWNLFVPFQCIETYGAKKWTALAGANGRFTLSVTNIYGNTTFYNYDGWRFNVATVQPTDEIFNHALALYLYDQGDEPMFLVHNNDSRFNETRNLYKTTFMKTFPKYELLESTMRAVQELNRSVYEDVLPKANTFNNTYTNMREEIVFLDNVAFTGHQTFNDVVVVGNTTVNSADISEIILSPSDLKEIQKLDGMNATIIMVEGLLFRANETLRDVVTKSGEQTITSRKSFYRNLTISSLVVENVHVGGNVNGIKISELRESALYLGENATISGELFFKNVSIRSVNVNGMFGGVLPSDVVTTDANETVTGSKTFSDTRFEGATEQLMYVKNSINGLNTKDLLTVHTDQNITANYVFNDSVSVIADVNVKGLLNGRYLSDLVQDTVMMDGTDTVINASKTFERMSIEGDINMRPNATVNGVDVSGLLDIGLQLSSTDFSSEVVFASDVRFLSHVNVEGTFNGINLTDVVFTDVDAVINAPITIRSDVESSANIYVTGTVNGLDMSDVLDTFTNQTIFTRKTFTSNVTFINDVITTGLVDGVNISDAYTRSLTMNTTQNVTGYKRFRRLTTLDKLYLGECVHDCKLLDVLRNIRHGCASESSEVVNITGHKFFRNLSVHGNAAVQTSVNKISMPGDLLLQGRNQTVLGPNYFLHDVTMQGNVLVRNINGISLSEMYQNAMHKSNLTFVSGISFHDDFFIHGDLRVSGAINNVDFKDVVKTSGNQTVTGRKTFTNRIDVHELIVNTMLTYGLIDGVNLTALHEELLSLTGHQIVKGTKIFKTGVSFAGNWSIPGLIDGVNITQLYLDAMTLGTDQRVTGHKTFTEKTSVEGNATVKGLVDNVNLTHLASYALLKSEANVTQYVNADMQFENISIVGDVNVVGSITDQNLTEIINYTLMKAGDQVITGVHRIVNMTVANEVNVNRTVNGINLSDEVVYLQEENVITGRKRFKNVTVHNIVAELIDGWNLTDIVGRVAYVDEDATLLGLVSFDKDIVIRNNLTVNNFINAHNITDIVRTAITKGGEQILLGPVHIQNAVFTGSVNTHLLNSVDFTNFSRNVIYRCFGPNRNIKGEISVSEMTVKGMLTVMNLLVRGLINEVDLVGLSEEVVRKSGVYIISSKKRITGELVVDNITTGPINGFTFPSDFISVTGTDLIIGRKIFSQDVLVKGHVNISHGIVINGVDISDIVNTIVQLGANETVTSNVVFLRNVTVTGNMKTILVNDLYISADELLLAYGNQTVTAPKTFSDVYVHGVVLSGNHINGYDLRKLENESYVSGRKNTMEGNMTILGDVYIQGNLWAGNLEDIGNITARFYGFNRIQTYLSVYIPSIYQSIGITRAVIAQLAASIENVHQSLDYFVDEQDIHLPYVSTSIDAYTIDGIEVWLAAGSVSSVQGEKCSNTTVFVRSYKNMSDSTFISKYKVLTNAVTGMKFVEDSSNLFLISSSNRRNDQCFPDIESSERSVTYFYSNSSDRFERRTSVETYSASGVDASVFQNSISVIFTNTYMRMSSCVNQTLYTLNDSVYVIEGSVHICSAMKSIILSQDTVSTKMAILGSTAEGYRQVKIVDFLRNGTAVVRQVIATDFASDVLHLKDNGNDFIVIANTYDSSEEALDISYSVPVAVYRLEPSGLYDHYQNIEVWAALKVQPLRVGIYHYLVVATYQQEIIVLKHKSASKWNVELTIPIQGYGSIKDVKTWTMNDEVYMAVLTSNIWNMQYPSKIRVMKGFLTSTVEGSDVISQVV